MPGIVVYKDVFFGSEQRKPQVGDQVWANQPLLILPDISKMVVETKVRETDIHKVEKNQQVRVRVEAYPDLKLTGAVTLVGTLAQEEKERRGTKFFGVTVQIKESRAAAAPGHDRAGRDPGARRGPRRSSCPSRRCSSATGATSCYVATRRGRVAREVVLGPSNAGLRGRREGPAPRGAGLPARSRRAALRLRRPRLRVSAKAPPLVELAARGKVYPRGAGDVVALDGVTLRIEAGEKVAIMGPSGSGKSTLLAILGCLDRPTAGEYRLDGESVASLDDARLSRIRNRRIGFVFQSFHLIPS